MRHETLYDEIAASGVVFDSHYSDLYFPANKDTDRILARWPREQKSARVFICRLDGKWWYDVPFAYIPYWTEKIEAGKRLGKC